MPGANECIRNLSRIQAEFTSKAKEATEGWCKEVLEESKSGFCPIDTGELKGSGKSKVETSSDENFTVSISYDAPHATTVHETPKNYRNGKQWKYLSTPFNQKSQKLVSDLEEALRSVV